jgi:DNA-binding PadR family transcriptional regulator
MHIQDALLGLISAGPATGYDLKKTMQRTELFHWSGNNNQVYQALKELAAQEWVRITESNVAGELPKKLYCVTEKGRDRLHEAALTTPELPQARRPFQLQLLFGQLSGAEATAQLDYYQDELHGLLAKLEAQGWLAGQTQWTPFQDAVRQASASALKAMYTAELDWIAAVRTAAAELSDDNEVKGTVPMRFEKRSAQGKDYAVLVEGLVNAAEDGVALITGCIEQGTNLLLLPQGSLGPEFFQLASRVAGEVLGKLSHYIKTAAVYDPTEASGRFAEFLSESNQGNAFRCYADQDEAVNWLVAGSTNFL